jgi:tetratricopeptide (TPR) repeat protein
MTYDEAFKRAVQLIDPNMRLFGRQPNSTPQGEAQLREGVSLLDVALALSPEQWVAWWLRGKAQQALDDHDLAYEAFRRASLINGEHVDVARELVAECLETRRATEAIPIAEWLCHREPTNAGLRANLAIAYLIVGRFAEALRSVNRALDLDPSDVVTAAVRRRIEDVRTGRWPQPKQLSDLSRRTTPAMNRNR